MKIRLAKLVDISNISTLYRTLFQTMAELQIEYYRKADQDVDFLKSVINSDTKDILVAEEDEQIIGFVLVQQLDTPPYACIVPHRYTLLMDIVVSDLYRGQGIGRALIEEAKLWSKRRGSEYIELSVVSQNRSAIEIYKSLQFVECTKIMRAKIYMVNSRSRCYAKEVKFMVAGHLQEKKGYFYMVLSYPNAAGKRKTKWLPTGLPVKGNKKKAEKMLMETRQTFVPECKPIQEDMLFSDFLLQWLEIAKPTIALTTYSSYSGMAKSVIIPYFKERKITLSEIKATDIQAFYMKQLKRVKANTVIHYHSVIHRALKYAVKIDLISVNPADKVERPKADKFIGSFYDSNEVQALFEAAKGTLIEIPIFLGAFYGLRRSEALGLKWDAIDFQNNTITIRHTVTSCNLDGKHIQIAQDTTKTKSSMRTLPLVPAFKEKLLKLKEQQEEYRRVCGRCYNKKYLEYICVDEMGTLISPHYLTASFPKLLEKNNLRHIRFHDLRHSCASLLLANGVPMKQIQEWLGHSDFSTTANVYAHLDYNSKLSSADAMVNGLSGALEVIS